MNEILITNGLIMGDKSKRPQDILIREETIVAVSDRLEVDDTVNVINADGKWIFPGVIDPHTHMGIPIKSGYSADSFKSGSHSALHGGVTSILDFTVLAAGESLEQSLQNRLTLARTSSCDVGLHVNITRYEPEILAEIPGLISRGFISFKVFTTYAEAGMMLSYDQIESVAKILGTHDGILMIHSEDNAVISAASEPFSNRKATHPRFHGISRPAEAELVAIQRLGEISQRTNCSMYIVHLNTKDGLLKAAEYPLLKVETCPHYLLLNQDVYERQDGAMFVASPPLRTPADSEALWQGIQDGLVHTIGSDHCPFCQADKPGDIPFQDIPNGMGGVETLFPTLLAQFIERGLDPGLLTQLTSANVAEIFALDHLKGQIKPGLHADLLIVDPKGVSYDWESRLETTLDWNAYAGLPAIFPETVVRRGEMVVENGRLKTSKSGQILKSLIRQK